MVRQGAELQALYFLQTSSPFYAHGRYHLLSYPPFLYLYYPSLPSEVGPPPYFSLEVY